jgi:outer membrane murein-binding lipoprotein Lpp
VITSPDAVAAGTALLVALITWLRITLNKSQQRLEERMTRMSAHVVRAANAAESASEGVHNNHPENLRDDLDGKFSLVLDGLQRLTAYVDELRASDREHDARMARIENQVEGVRNDARTDRSHLYAEVQSLHSRIDRVKTETTPLRQEP